MSDRIETMPKLPAFMCVRCKKEPVFMYRLSRYKLGKLCASCATKAFEELFQELDNEVNND